MQLDVTFYDVNYSNLMSLHVVSESRVDSTKKKRINNQRWQSIAGAIRVVSMILSMTGCVFLLVGRISTSSMLIDVLWFRKFLFGRCFFLSFQLVSFRCLELESDRRLLIGWRAAPFVVSTSFDCCRFAFVFLFPPFDWLLSFARTPSNLPVPSGPGANWQAIRQRLRRIFFFFFFFYSVAVTAL